MRDHVLVRVLAGLCAMLALICVGLAVAYGRKVEQLRCYAEAIEVGLTPPEICDRPR